MGFGKLLLISVITFLLNKAVSSYCGVWGGGCEGIFLRILFFSIHFWMKKIEGEGLSWVKHSFGLDIHAL